MIHEEIRITGTNSCEIDSGILSFLLEALCEGEVRGGINRSFYLFSSIEPIEIYFSFIIHLYS